MWCRRHRLSPRTCQGYPALYRVKDLISGCLVQSTVRLQIVTDSEFYGNGAVGDIRPIKTRVSNFYKGGSATPHIPNTMYRSSPIPAAPLMLGLLAAAPLTPVAATVAAVVV